MVPWKAPKTLLGTELEQNLERNQKCKNCELTSSGLDVSAFMISLFTFSFFELKLSPKFDKDKRGTAEWMQTADKQTSVAG